MDEIIKEIQGIIDSYNYRFIPEIKEKVINVEIIKKLIFSEMSELLTILSMIQLRMNEIHLDPENKKIKKEDINRQFVKINELKVLIKVVYEWLFHLRELIKKDKKIELLVSPKLKDKLDYYCEYRSKLVTHKQKMKEAPLDVVQVSGGNDGIDSMEILVRPIMFPESAEKELNALFLKCGKYLDSLEISEKNKNRQVDILVKNRFKMKEEKKEVISFMERYGANSDNIMELAEFIRKLIKDLIPKLSKI